MPISRLVELLRTDDELQATLGPEHSQQFNKDHAAYEANEIGRKEFIDRLCCLVGKPKVLSTVKMALAQQREEAMAASRAAAGMERVPAPAAAGGATGGATGGVLPIARLVDMLRNDLTLSTADWKHFDQMYARYESKSIGRKHYIDELCKLVGKTCVLKTVRAAKQQRQQGSHDGAP